MGLQPVNAVFDNPLARPVQLLGGWGFILLFPSLQGHRQNFEMALLPYEGDKVQCSVSMQSVEILSFCIVSRAIPNFHSAAPSIGTRRKSLET